MKKLLLILMSFCIFPSLAYSQKVEGTYTVGAFGGTPFWNQQNIEEGIVNPSYDFVRLYNNLRFKASYSDFSIKFSALRNDHFFVEDGHVFIRKDEHIQENKIFQMYGNYKFGDGNYVRAGRFMPMNRWYFRPVDGGSLHYEVDDNISFTGYGGYDVDYGGLFDDNIKDPIGYAQAAYRKDNYGGKLKYMYLNESNKVGLDLFGGYKFIRASLDLGYDFTQDKIFDGQIGLYAYPMTNLSVSAHVARYVPMSWTYEFYSHTIERYQAAATYKINRSWAVNLQQLLLNSNEAMNYVTYLSLAHRYFFLGLNYVGGSSDDIQVQDTVYAGKNNFERFGISIGGNYPVTDYLRVRAGVGAVDYLFSRLYAVEEENEHVMSYTSYLTVDYDVLDFLALRGHLSYYHQFEAMPQKLRGGITAQLKFEGGE